MKNALEVLAICPRCTKGGNIFDEHDLTAGAAAVVGVVALLQTD
jgi:hypothetical protein